jgi:hypothetical protein
VALYVACGAKPNSLAPLGPAVLPLLKMDVLWLWRTSLAALCNERLCSRRLRGSPATQQTNTRYERPSAIPSPLRLPACCCCY